MSDAGDLRQRLLSGRLPQRADGGLRVPGGLRAPGAPLGNAPLGNAARGPASAASRPQASPRSPRKKVGLMPGCSPMDWARLTRSGTNLRGISAQEFPLKVTKAMLQHHAKKEDCWTVLQGRVYNITAYVRFHPGGEEELLRCAGCDGTALFMKYHAWVNFERMLESCMVGFYIG